MGNAENPHAGQGAVVLDIGGDIGAVIVSTPPQMAGTEIEICPSGRRDQPPDDGVGWWQGDWHNHSHQHTPRSTGQAHGPAWPHVAVIARPTPTGPRHCAVFPALRAGVYDLWIRPGCATTMTVAVSGAHVTEASWPPQPTPTNRVASDPTRCG